jgi:hypothetical protein
MEYKNDRLRKHENNVVAAVGRCKSDETGLYCNSDAL